MKPITFKHILIAASAPLGLLAVVSWCITMFKYREFNGIGVIVMIYYFVPILIFTCLFVLSVNLLNKAGVRFLSTTLIGQAIVSAFLMILMSAVWIIFDHGLRFQEISFLGYLWLDVKRNWFPLVFLALAIPLTLRILQAGNQAPPAPRPSERGSADM